MDTEAEQDWKEGQCTAEHYVGGGCATEKDEGEVAAVGGQVRREGASIVWSLVDHNREVEINTIVLAPFVLCGEVEINLIRRNLVDHNREVEINLMALAPFLFLLVSDVHLSPGASGGSDQYLFKLDTS